MWFGGLGSRQSMGLQGLSLCTGDISTAGAFPLEFVSGVEGYVARTGDSSDYFR